MSKHATPTLAAAFGLLAVTLVSGLGALATPARAQSDAETADPSLRPGQLADPGQPGFGTGGWRTDFSISSVHFDDIVSGGPPKDGIPAIDEPVFESIARRDPPTSGHRRSPQRCVRRRPGAVARSGR